MNKNVNMYEDKKKHTWKIKDLLSDQLSLKGSKSTWRIYNFLKYSPLWRLYSAFFVLLKCSVTFENMHKNHIQSVSLHSQN